MSVDVMKFYNSVKSNSIKIGGFKCYYKFNMILCK